MTLGRSWLRRQDPREVGRFDDLAALGRTEAPTERAEDPREQRTDQKRITGSSDDEQRQPEDQTEQHPCRRDDRRGEDFPGGRVAEEKDRPLQGLVENAAPDATDHVGEAGSEEHAPHGRVGIAVEPLAELVAHERAGQDEEQAEAFDEDHGPRGPFE